MSVTGGAGVVTRDDDLQVPTAHAQYRASLRQVVQGDLGAAGSEMYLVKSDWLYGMSEKCFVNTLCSNIFFRVTGGRTGKIINILVFFFGCNAMYQNNN